MALRARLHSKAMTRARAGEATSEVASTNPKLKHYDFVRDRSLQHKWQVTVMRLAFVGCVHTAARTVVCALVRTETSRQQREREKTRDLSGVRPPFFPEGADLLGGR